MSDAKSATRDAGIDLEVVAGLLLGGSPTAQSSERIIHYGSVTIDTVKNKYFDSQTDEVGGTLDFIMREKHCDETGARTWLAEAGSENGADHGQSNGAKIVPPAPKPGDHGGDADTLGQIVRKSGVAPKKKDAPLVEKVVDEIARAALQIVSPDAAAVWYEPGKESECREALDKVVGSHSRTFMAGDALVIPRVHKVDVPDTTWNGDLPATTPAQTADIIERAEQLHWMMPAGGKGDKRWKRAKPPRDFCGDYLIQRRREYGARPLKGIARVPFMRDDGTIDTCLGYSQETGIFCDELPNLCVPDNPSKDDALAAAERLMHPYSLYKPGDEQAFKPLMLAALFTALERPFLDTAPMFALNGAQSGTGKGEIIRAIGRLALNTAPPLMSWGHDDTEFKKRFDAMMLLSPAMFGIDNANGKLLSHDALEMLLTEGVITIRIFGKLENVTFRPRTSIFINGNNLSIAGDMIRRCFVIGILPRCAEPESEAFPFTPSGYAAKHRDELLSDAYTIMRAFRLAGMPKTATSSVGSFPDWERKVRNLVHWLTGYDLTEEFAKNKARDPVRQETVGLLSALHDLYEDAWFKAADVEADVLKAQDVRRQGKQDTGPDDRKRDAILDAASACIQGQITSKGISRAFGQWINAHHDGYVLQAGHDQHTKVKVWRVKGDSV